MATEPQAIVASCDRKTASIFPTLDTKVLESATTERSFLIELLDGFSAAAPRRMADIEAALDAENASALRETAHALKSLSSCIGAMGLLQICESIEAIGKGARHLPALPLVKEANAEYEKVKIAIERYREAL